MTTSTLAPVTELELEVLNSIVNSEYQDGTDMADLTSNWVYVYSCETISKGKARSGIFSSLAKKELIQLGSADEFGEMVRFTEAGYTAWANK